MCAASHPGGDSPRFRAIFARELLGMSLASVLGVSFSGWLPRLAAAAGEAPAARAKACILLWMNGGPSQTDTFDLKPGHANGGTFKEIATAVPGMRISEHLPGMAKEMKDLAIIRSLSTTEGEHGLATQLMLTGYQPRNAAVRYPCLGSLLSKELGRDDSDLPNYRQPLADADGRRRLPRAELLAADGLGRQRRSRTRGPT